jgi:segregation and condensation protein B
MSEENIVNNNLENENLNNTDLADTELSAEVSQVEDLQVDPADINALVEALIFASLEPLSVSRIVQVTGLNAEEVEKAINDLQSKNVDEQSGLELVCVADKYQFRTKAKFAGFIRDLRAGRPRKLSLQALETLAIVAYRQPIVKSDIEKIRGVDATPTLKTLLDRQIIKIVGHQNTVGQPALYGTTEEFLKLFGLASLSELPTLRDLKELEEPSDEDTIENVIEMENEDLHNTEEVEQALVENQ